MVKILLVEDDGEVRSALSRSLSVRGHTVDCEPSGMAGLHSAVERTPDVVLLGLRLPDVDGLQVLSMLRAVSAVPVIALSADDEPAEVVRALDSGADDCVATPCDVDQLDARVRAVLRRNAPDRRQEPLRIGGLTIYVAARRVTLDGCDVQLSPKTFDLLLALARRAGEVVTKRELLADVWCQSNGASERTVDVHLSWLRRKLGESAAAPVYLHSVRKHGVRMREPDQGAGGVLVPLDEVAEPEPARLQPDRR